MLSSHTPEIFIESSFLSKNTGLIKTAVKNLIPVKQSQKLGHTLWNMLLKHWVPKKQVTKYIFARVVQAVRDSWQYQGKETARAI